MTELRLVSAFSVDFCMSISGGHPPWPPHSRTGGGQVATGIGRIKINIRRELNITKVETANVFLTYVFYESLKNTNFSLGILTSI